VRHCKALREGTAAGAAGRVTASCHVAGKVSQSQRV